MLSLITTVLPIASRVKKPQGHCGRVYSYRIQQLPVLRFICQFGYLQHNTSQLIDFTKTMSQTSLPKTNSTSRKKTKETSRTKAKDTSRTSKKPHQQHAKQQQKQEEMQKPAAEMQVKKQAKQGLIEGLVIENTRFRPITPRQKRMIEKKRFYYCNPREWIIDFQRFAKQDWAERFTHIESVSIHNLWLNNNRQTAILKSIAPCSFTELLILHLHDNNILSLDQIQLLKAQKLSRLDLSLNHITNLKSLRKATLPRIEWLSLNDNPVKDYHSIAEFHCPKMQKLQLKRKTFNCLDESISWLMPLESSCLSKVDCSAFRRIEQLQQKEMVSQKFTAISIKWMEE